MNLALSWWQSLLFWPGMTFMDWLARNHPDIVIQHGFGFHMESYLLWSALISAVAWTLLVVTIGALLRKLRRLS